MVHGRYKLYIRVCQLIVCDRIFGKNTDLWGMMFKVLAYWLHFECRTYARLCTRISQNHLYCYCFCIVALEVGFRSVQIATDRLLSILCMCGTFFLGILVILHLWNYSSWNDGNSDFANTVPQDTCFYGLEHFCLCNQPPFQTGWASSVFSAPAFEIIAHFFYCTVVKVDFCP